MQGQGSFAEAEDAGKKKQTRRDRFLAEMAAAVPPAFAGAGCGGGWWSGLRRSIPRASAVVRRSHWTCRGSSRRGREPQLRMGYSAGLTSVSRVRYRFRPNRQISVHAIRRWSWRDR